MISWIWKNLDLASFDHDPVPLRALEDTYLHLGGQSVALLEDMEAYDQSEAKAHLYAVEAARNFGHAGVPIDQAALQKSVRQQLGLARGKSAHTYEASIATLISRLESGFNDPLTTSDLHKWNGLLSGEDPVNAGAYRYRSSGFTQSENQSAGRRPYTDPPADHVPELMDDFIAWFNQTQTTLPALTRAAIALHAIDVIRPFNKGNARLGRMLALKTLRQAAGSPPVAMLSKAIRLHQASFQRDLEASRTRDSALQNWIVSFAKTAIAAQEGTIKRIRFMRSKIRFQEKSLDRLNPRQQIVMMRMYDAGPDGFIAGLDAAKYREITGASVPTTTRDLNGLVDAGMLTRTSKLRFARYHLKV